MFSGLTRQRGWSVSTGSGQGGEGAIGVDFGEEHLIEALIILLPKRHFQTAKVKVLGFPDRFEKIFAGQIAPGLLQNNQWRDVRQYSLPERQIRFWPLYYRL